MTIRQVSADEALRDWDFYEERLNRVVERTDSPHGTDDILTCLQLGSMQLWRCVNGDGVGVTELQTYPRYKRLLVYMVAGEHATDWLTGADQQLSDFAISNKCTHMVFHGRPGWAKWCGAFGYVPTLVVMQKVPEHGRRRSANAEFEERALGSPATLP
jgi:hypothetical protein